MNTNRIRHQTCVALFGGSVLGATLIFLVSVSPSNAQKGESSSTLPKSTLSQIDFTQPITTYLPIISNNPPDWVLTWNDEFNESGGVNTSDWICDIGTGYPGGPANWGTGEVEEMSCSTDNVFQSAGYLNIRAIHTGTNSITGWTSGRIETVRTDFQPLTNGEMAVEARIQLPNITGASAQGYWPAFWMLGAPYRGNYWNWPSIGEVDIMENINGINQWWGTLHCGTSPGGPCNETSGLGGSSSGFSPSLQNDFHTYRMEFDKSVSPQQIRWYVDGIQHYIVYSNQVDATTWNNATDHGFFIILNVAIGGGWPGNPTLSTSSGETLLVDYVRVYAKN